MGISLAIEVTEIVADVIVRLFERSKPLGAALVGVVILFSGTIAVQSYEYGRKLAQRERERVDLTTIQNDTQLAEVLRAVSAYSERTAQDARAKADEAQRAAAAVEELKRQAADYNAIVAAKKSDVDALFREAEARADKGFWKAQWFSFGMGVLSSLVATFLIWTGFKARALWKSRHP